MEEKGQLNEGQKNVWKKIILLGSVLVKITTSDLERALELLSKQKIDILATNGICNYDCLEITALTKLYSLDF